ncbi:outer membrane beta-barrel protein [Massilia yuzhufengensis]|uniref:OmpA-OmpF porin, OOP family n=1 Tax=Massilia yuzhufengensis TaxID=1164594 RepID=A0A1I1QS96_9BURK|nr:outer membrane beta-barrel protein [Massilia yuzhufengensis]SFD24991.1 OmpA-OmpF porin, OOP family [Massilia yuzhufengensis]
MFKKIAAVTTLILASSAAVAAQPGTVYAGADVGKTKIDGFNRDTSVGAFVGYNFHQNFAIEAGYRRLADYEFRMGGSSVDVSADQLALSVIGSMPVGESFSVYGRLGANRLEAKSRFMGASIKDSTTKALYGVGVSYAFTPAVSARLEVQKPSSDSTNLSAGVAFQF